MINYSFSTFSLSEKYYPSLELQTEIIRKSIHMLIAIVPLLVTIIGRNMTGLLLMYGIVIYTIVEFLRIHGINIPLISCIINLSARKRDKGFFIMAPITLAMGAILSLMLYSEPAFSVAIYALAFGDSFSSIFGKMLGRKRFKNGKSFEGSFACFVAVFLSTFLVLKNAMLAMPIAVLATILEYLPTKDLDNMILPVGTGIFTILLIM